MDYFGADRTKRQILLLLADHITHHRGQMLVYMRLKGIKPPRYVLYQ
nr:DinB family protein [Algibacter pectinivorans]